MNARKSILMLGSTMILAAVTGIWGNVRAQENPEADLDLDLTVRSDARLSGQQQLQWIEGQQSIAKRISFSIQGMLDQARREKDILKITCLNDKLTQIHVNLEGVEERVAALRVAVQAQDTTAANQQFAILRIYISRIQGLKAEAENCLGEVDVVLGETETIVTVDEDITGEDPSKDLPPVDIGIDQPPHASAFY